MSKTIEIRLSDAQCEALGTEAEAAGLKFFDHCRAKLLANMLVAPKPVGEGGTAPVLIRTAFQHGEVSPALKPPPRVERDGVAVRDRNVTIPAAAAPPPDRIDRLEALVLQMAETVSSLAQPQAYAPDQVQEQYDPNIDVDDVVNASLGEAERQGLTVVDREPASTHTGGVRHVGTRPPAPFSPAVQPRHLLGLGAGPNG